MHRRPKSSAGKVEYVFLTDGPRDAFRYCSGEEERQKLSRTSSTRGLIQGRTARMTGGSLQLPSMAVYFCNRLTCKCLKPDKTAVSFYMIMSSGMENAHRSEPVRSHDSEKKMVTSHQCSTEFSYAWANDCAWANACAFSNNLNSQDFRTHATIGSRQSQVGMSPTPPLHSGQPGNSYERT